MKLTENGIIINIKISPNAKKNEIIKENGFIKLKITAQPIEGKANKAIIEYFSKLFKIPKNSIRILKGETSKEKTILLETTDTNKLQIIKETF